jgi:hypothetical protein
MKAYRRESARKFSQFLLGWVAVWLGLLAVLKVISLAFAVPEGGSAGTVAGEWGLLLAASLAGLLVIWLIVRCALPQETHLRMGHRVLIVLLAVPAAVGLLALLDWALIAALSL